MRSVHSAGRLSGGSPACGDLAGIARENQILAAPPFRRRLPASRVVYDRRRRTENITAAPREDSMRMQDEFAQAREQWALLSFYQKFEHAVIVILTGLIAVVIAFAMWNLVLKLAAIIFLTGALDPTDYTIFQALFGMIFTVLIALEFKRSLLVIAERRESVVQVRTVVLIALLAIVRKLLIIDLPGTDAAHLFGLAATILALGSVYWLVRDQDRRHAAPARGRK
jgi:uncharacterized membrane protein (DUF373 family)